MSGEYSKVLGVHVSPGPIREQVAHSNWELGPRVRDHIEQCSALGLVAATLLPLGACGVREGAASWRQRASCSGHLTELMTREDLVGQELFPLVVPPGGALLEEPLHWPNPNRSQRAKMPVVK